MSEKQLPDDFYEDLQWEIEADKSWDAFYMAHGIDRSQAIRDCLESFPPFIPWWKRLWNWMRGKANS